MNDTPCPCGNPAIYAECCHLYHAATDMPNTAEKLMRSRYCAFFLKREDYLLRTWHKNTRPKKLELCADVTDWQRLEILRIHAGGCNDISGKVEFKAYYSIPEGIGYLHEISKFVRENGIWFYLDGKIKPMRR